MFPGHALSVVEIGLVATCTCLAASSCSAAVLETSGRLPQGPARRSLRNRGPGREGLALRRRAGPRGLAEPFDCFRGSRRTPSPCPVGGSQDLLPRASPPWSTRSNHLIHLDKISRRSLPLVEDQSHRRLAGAKALFGSRPEASADPPQDLLLSVHAAPFSSYEHDTRPGLRRPASRERPPVHGAVSESPRLPRPQHHP